MALPRTLGLSSEQDRKICVPTAKKKEGWALQAPLQLPWATLTPPVFHPLLGGWGESLWSEGGGVEGRGGRGSNEKREAPRYDTARDTANDNDDHVFPGLPFLSE